MFYSKEDKELLGRYFKYYREKNKITIKSITTSGICEYRTYKKIEEGKVKNNDDLYDSLLSYFHIQPIVLIQLNEAKTYIHELYEGCENYDKKRIDNNLNAIIKIVHSVSNTKIICELLKTLSFIKEFYLNEKFLNNQEANEALNYIQLWKNELSTLLIEVIGKSNMNFILKNEVFDKMRPYLNINDRICRYWYARICVFDVNYIEAEKHLQYLLECYTQNNNNLRKSRIVMDLHSLYRDTDYNKAEEYTVLMNELKEYNLPKTMKEALYYNLGMYYYLSEKYEEALLNYEKSNEVCNDPLTILFICACQSHMNNLYYYEVDHDHILYPYIKYFQLKSKNTDSLMLEDYIIEKLLKYLTKEKYEQPFWKMFSYEMGVLVKQTRNYKKYLEFQEKMQFATKRVT